MAASRYIEGMEITEHNKSGPMVAASPMRQSLVGLFLAASVFAGWLAIHIWAMFFLRLEGAAWLLVPLIFAVQCWLSVGMFIVAHDAMHGSLSPKWPKLAEILGGVLLFLYAGFAWKGMRDAHFDHHKFVGGKDDPDFNADNPHDFWPWYMLFLKRYFGWMSMAWIATVVLGYYLILRLPPANIIFLYGFPAIASSFQLFYFGTYRPHRHESDGFSDRHNARTNDFGKAASLFSCFHFGYHHEHHLSPSLPWWALPARHDTYMREQDMRTDVP